MEHLKKANEEPQSVFQSRKLVGEVLGSLYQAREDICQIKAGKTVIYFPDFNYVHPNIYTQTESRYHFTDMFGSCLFALNDSVAKPSEVKLCISMPTIVELLFSLQRHHNFLQKSMFETDYSQQIYDYMVGLQEGKISFREASSVEIRRFFLSSGKLQNINKKVDHLVESMKSGKIEMLTDHYSAEEINRALTRDKQIYARIGSTMASTRGQLDLRDDVNRIISYKADTHNIFLPILNKDSSPKVMNFVCSGRFQKWTPIDTLKFHQKPPLTPISIIGNLGAVRPDLPLAEKMAQIQALVENGINEGLEIFRYLEKYQIIPLDMGRRITAFLQSNLICYIDMAKQKTSYSGDMLDEFVTRTTSYKQYLEVVEGNKIQTAETMKTLHKVINDSDDDMYRDFMDDTRIRSHLPALKLG